MPFPASGDYRGWVYFQLMTRLLVLVSLLVSLLLASTGMSATLLWDPHPQHPILAGFRIYQGTNSRQYDKVYEVHRDRNFGFATGLASNTMYYFAVTAYDQEGLESGYSAEVTFDTAGAYTNYTNTIPGGDWTTNINNVNPQWIVLKVDTVILQAWSIDSVFWLEVPGSARTWYIETNYHNFKPSLVQELLRSTNTNVNFVNLTLSTGVGYTSVFTNFLIAPTISLPALGEISFFQGRVSVSQVVVTNN